MTCSNLVLSLGVVRWVGRGQPRSAGVRSQSALFAARCHARSMEVALVSGLDMLWKSQSPKLKPCIVNAILCQFTYLKGQLRGSPLSLIESLDVSEQTYDVACDLLRRAFASPVTRKFDAIKRLSNLRLQSGTDPFSFVGELRSITNQFNDLNIDIDSIL